MRRTKALAAILAAVTLTVGSIGMTIYAAEKETAVTETEEKQYDINNASYRARVDSLTRDPYEKAIIEFLKVPTGNSSNYDDIVHYYGGYAEYKYGEKSRYFHDLSINFNQSYISFEDKFSDADEVVSKVNAFLKENSLNGEFKKTEYEHYFMVEFDESCTDGDKAKTWTALKKKWGFSCSVWQTDLGTCIYTDGLDITDDQLRSLFGTEYTKYEERDHYDLKNAAYKKYVDMHLKGCRLINDPRLLRVVNALTTFTGKAVNVYKDEGSEYERYAVEYEMPDGSRVFDLGTNISVVDSFNCLKESGEMYTMEELEAFAKKHDYDITFERYRDNGKKIRAEIMEMYPERSLYQVEFNERYSLAEKLEISIAMSKELGTKLPRVNRYGIGDNIFFKDGFDCGFYNSGLRIYTDGSSHGEREEITFDTEDINDIKDIPALPTVIGDADMNGAVELSDLTAVAKYNLNNESFPLLNDTAFANADVNFDGVVNGLDISMLIERQLGKKSKS